ncbi:type II toxin-antitoxin system RelE/ParE family toxin [Nocardia nova]|uniref:type II toxin-antitoxin system RelE/ParE family toxin n=1 Tax=Nocardia nova TaxID=37330 RepID=UPI0033C65B82
MSGISSVGIGRGERTVRRVLEPLRSRTCWKSKGRPTVDRIKGSRLRNLKELRPAATNIRILFAFDPERQAVLLVAGDKTGNWAGWYRENIPVAEERYDRWLNGDYDEEG